MKWLTNLYDPRRRDAIAYVSRMGDETHAEAWANQQRWLRGKVIGAPKASETVSASDMIKMGLVGIYEAEANAQPHPALATEAM